jgi:glutathione S-transferase
MPTLLFASASPYSAKCRMAAAIGQIALDTKTVVTSDEPESLTGANPLGKIPTLICDDGFSVFDSRAIMQELDRLSGKTLYPRYGEKRRTAERLEAAADGLCDALLAQVYERRMRPEEKVHEPWLAYQDRKVERALDWLNDNIGRLGKVANGGQIAVYCAIGYVQLRFPDLDWSRKRPRLKRFIARFEEQHGDVAALKPA